MSTTTKILSETAPPTLDSRPAEGTPAVSVIIPAYNVAHLISEALDSVLAQTFTDYEIIVVNDGSPDTEELERILESYGQRITYLKQENRGLSGARNSGIRAARAPLIALLDADDLWKPEYLSVQVEIMRADPTIDVVYPNALNFGDGPYAGRVYMDDCPSKGTVTFESLVSERCQVMVSVIARRDTLLRTGLFDESLRSVEDFDMWLRIMKKGGRIVYHRQILVLKRCWLGSLSSDQIWMYEHVIRVLQKAQDNLELTPSERDLVLRQIKGYHAKIALHTGKQSLLRGDIKATLDRLRAANTFFRSPKLAVVIVMLRVTPSLLRSMYARRDGTADVKFLNVD